MSVDLLDVTRSPKFSTVEQKDLFFCVIHYFLNVQSDILNKSYCCVPENQDTRQDQ